MYLIPSSQEWLAKTSLPTFWTQVGFSNLKLGVQCIGIMLEHSEFEGRAMFGANFADGNDTDGNGHGFVSLSFKVLIRP